MLTAALKLGTMALFALAFGFGSNSSPWQRLSDTVNTFRIGCERLLTAVAQGDRLTQDEIELIEYYCKEVLEQLVPQKQKV